MNKTIIRILCALLTLLMLTACFAACSDPADPNEGDGTEAPAGDGTQNPAGDGETSAPEQSIDEILGFEIPNLNKSFNVLYQKGIERGVIRVSGDGICSFNPSVE